MTGTATHTPAQNNRTTGLLGEPAGDLQLRVRGTEHDGRLVRITSEKCSVGSAANCTLRLNAAGVQPLHCLILRGTNGTFIRRCGPHTKLNGNEFRDALLRKGDQLSIGPLQFEVVDDAAQPDPHTQRPLQKLLDDVAALGPVRSTDSQVLESRLSRIESLLNSSLTDAAPRSTARQEPSSELADLTVRLRSLESQPWSKSHEQLVVRLDRLEKSVASVANRAPQIDANELTNALTTLADGAAQTQHQLGGLSQQLQRATQQWTDFHGQFESLSETVTESHSQLRELRGELTDVTNRVQQLESRPETRLESVSVSPTVTVERSEAHHEEIANEPVPTVEEADPRDSTPIAQFTPPAPEASPQVDWEKRLKEWRTSLEAKAAENRPPVRPETLSIPDEAEDDSPAEPVTPTLSFASPTRTAPLSTMDVLREMGGAALLDELEDEQLNGPTPSPVAPRPNTPAPEPRREPVKPLSTPASAPKQAAGDDEESIESYMERLMTRVRGDSKSVSAPTAPTRTVATTPTVKPEPTMKREPASTPVTEPVRAPEPSVPEKYVPRSMAPELTSNLSAMRELANQSARSAIVTSVKRRSGLAAVGKLACAVTSVAMSGVLFYLSTDLQSPTFFGGVAGLGAAAYWFSQSLSLLRDRIKPRS